MTDEAFKVANCWKTIGGNLCLGSSSICLYKNADYLMTFEQIVQIFFYVGFCVTVISKYSIAHSSLINFSLKK